MDKNVNTAVKNTSKSAGKMPEKQAVEQLMTVMSLAAQQGNEEALKVMDHVQTIMTSDWEDLPEELREKMAYVMAQILCESTMNTDDKTKESIE